MSFVPTNPDSEIIFPNMDDLEAAITAPPAYTVPNVDLDSPPISSSRTINIRARTHKVRHLLQFATDPLANYLSGLVAQARNAFVNPPPTAEQLQTLQDRVTTLTTERDAAITNASAIQTQLDTANTRITALTSSGSTGTSTQATAAILQMQTELDQLTTDNNEMQEQLISNQETLGNMQIELDAHLATISDLRTQNTSLEDRITSLTSQLATAQEIRPQDSISNANTQALTHPSLTPQGLYLAAVAALYADLSVTHPHHNFLSTSWTSLSQMATHFSTCARIILNPSSANSANAVERTIAHSASMTMELVPFEGQYSPPEQQFIAACLNTHSREEIQEIASNAHTSCRFNDACFFASFTRLNTPNNRLRINDAASLCYSTFVREELRPRRYPVTYALFIRWIRSPLVLRAISDIIARSSE